MVDLGVVYTLDCVSNATVTVTLTSAILNLASASTASTTQGEMNANFVPLGSLEMRPEGRLTTALPPDPSNANATITAHKNVILKGGANTANITRKVSIVKTANRVFTEMLHKELHMTASHALARGGGSGIWMPTAR
jgi:hypothetical protein